MEATATSKEPRYHSLFIAETVGSVLCVSRRTLRRWVVKGHFPQPRYVGPYGSPRWHPDDVVEYLRESGGRKRRNPNKVAALNLAPPQVLARRLSKLQEELPEVSSCRNRLWPTGRES
jgi:predicted DNA-binding transcriptional regulator AlpA